MFEFDQIQQGLVIDFFLIFEEDFLGCWRKFVQILVKIDFWFQEQINNLNKIQTIINKLQATGNFGLAARLRIEMVFKWIEVVDKLIEMLEDLIKLFIKKILWLEWRLPWFWPNCHPLPLWTTFSNNTYNETEIEISRSEFSSELDQARLLLDELSAFNITGNDTEREARSNSASELMGRLTVIPSGFIGEIRDGVLECVPGLWDWILTWWLRKGGLAESHGINGNRISKFDSYPTAPSREVYK